MSGLLEACSIRAYFLCGWSPEGAEEEAVLQLRFRPAGARSSWQQLRLQHFSDYNVQGNHLGIWLKCRV